MNEVGLDYVRGKGQPGFCVLWGLSGPRGKCSYGCVRSCRRTEGTAWTKFGGMSVHGFFGGNTSDSTILRKPNMWGLGRTFCRGSWEVGKRKQVSCYKAHVRQSTSDCIVGHERQTPKDFNLGRGAFRPVLERDTGWSGHFHVLGLACVNHLCAELPGCDVSLKLTNWEYLHHRNRQMMHICFLLPEDDG